MVVGYEGLEFKKEKNVILISLYVIVINFVEDLFFWYKCIFIWEIVRLYIYMRIIVDNRIIIGGLDEDINIV